MKSQHQLAKQKIKIRTTDKKLTSSLRNQMTTILISRHENHTNKKISAASGVFTTNHHTQNRVSSWLCHKFNDHHHTTNHCADTCIKDLFAKAPETH